LSVLFETELDPNRLWSHM